MIQAICLEMSLQQQYAPGTEITSIYIGGGTPSLLEEKDLDRLFHELRQHFTWKPDIEITLEANPDDISFDKTRLWKKTGINRLSIGIQSIHNAHLVFMNRAHDRRQAVQCIDLAQDAGFENLTCDVIYGLPGSTSTQLEENLSFLLSKNIPHISAYALTVEEKTRLHHQVKKNIIPAPDDKTMEAQFLLLTKMLKIAGLDHYEISNFGKPGFYAVHNTRYWQGDTYLGLGPSAHSYTGTSRRWNLANNALYLKSVFDKNIPFEEEVLTAENIYNEYVMTGLRTSWGVDKQKIRSFGPDVERHFLTNIEPFMEKDLVVFDITSWKLTEKGKLFADSIASDLFIV